MTIQLWVGGIGSGKTAMAVRMMAQRPNERFYSNIKCSLPHIIPIESKMIVTKQLLGQRRTGAKVYEYGLNADYWKAAIKPLSVVLDEAHAVYDSRKAMSKPNQVMNQYLALLRRMLGEDSTGAGDLIMITQLPFRIDIFAREMASQVRDHLCTWIKRCGACGAAWREDSGMPEHSRRCLACGGERIRRSDFIIEVKCFQGMQPYMAWKMFGMKAWYRRYYVDDVADYFGKYDTLEWTGLLSDIYT